ncbi:hypothetical protein HZ326_28640 [Fusarium oxysporum f. sp. albedinis]|jgi:uncharacterized heparinase superfamily protein|nr:hypothetical protein HZ326_28640 [Fusarium oxysporum f. sp. albedinis]
MMYQLIQHCLTTTSEVVSESPERLSWKIENMYVPDRFGLFRHGSHPLQVAQLEKAVICAAILAWLRCSETAFIYLWC